MHYYGVTLLSSILMLAILFDVIRFPLLRKDRGSWFFSELTIAYSIYVVLSLILMLDKQGVISFPLTVHRVVWAAHALALPFMLSAWMHFNAINVMDDPKLVTILTIVHDIPLVVLAVLTIRDIPTQQFYPLNPTFEQMLPSSGSTYMLSLSAFYCFAMLMPTLGHRKNLQGSFLFISLLLPLSFAVSLFSLAITHFSLLFMMVNAFMLVLYYLVGQRDSITFDSLTGLPTEALLQRKLIRLFRFQTPYTIILVDIENFPYFIAKMGRYLPIGCLSILHCFSRPWAARMKSFVSTSNSSVSAFLPARADQAARSSRQSVNAWSRVGKCKALLRSSR